MIQVCCLYFYYINKKIQVLSSVKLSLSLSLSLSLFPSTFKWRFEEKRWWERGWYILSFVNFFSSNCYDEWKITEEFQNMAIRVDEIRIIRNYDIGCGPWLLGFFALRLLGLLAPGCGSMVLWLGTSITDLSFYHTQLIYTWL